MVRDMDLVVLRIYLYDSSDTSTCIISCIVSISLCSLETRIQSEYPDIESTMTQYVYTLTLSQHSEIETLHDMVYVLVLSL